MSFLKSKKPSDSRTNVPSRMRLPTESGLRDQQGIKDLLESAQERRGSLIELPWTTSVPNQKYTLTVKWDKGASHAIWTLYEESDAGSKTVWSQPFAPTEVEFLYEVISFSIGSASQPKAQIPEHLKPGAKPLEPESSKSAGSADGGKKTTSKASTTQNTAPQAPSAPPPTPPQSNPPQSNPAQPSANHPPSGYGYQPAGGPLGSAMPMQPMPGSAIQGLPAQPILGQPGMSPYPPGFYPGYAQPPAGYPGWNYNQPMPAPPSGTIPGIIPSIDPGMGKQAPHTSTMEFLIKEKGILLGNLLIEAELITEPTLEAALKLQELVSSGRLKESRAPEILKLFFSMGAAIENFIDPSELLPPDPATRVEKKEDDDKGLSVDVTNALAFDLLIKAGLLTEGDVQLAKQVRKKHGGEVSNILQATGKINKKTMEAALICVDLAREGKMKIEQSIIALNYLSRSRISFDEAIKELGWEDPRKKPKKK